MAQLKVGDIFNIQVNIKEAQNVYGIESYLIYPHNNIEILLEADAPVIARGNFMDEDSAFKPTIKQGDEFGVGVLEVLCSLQGEVEEKTGEGILFTIKARALKEGTHTLQWHDNSTVLNKKLEPELNKFENYMLEILTTDDEVNVIYITVIGEGQGEND